MIQLEISVLEDALPFDRVSNFELGRAHAPASLLAFWQQAFSILESHPALLRPSLNPDLVRKGFGKAPVTCNVMLCTRASMAAMTDCPDALGVHLVSTPEGDPFGEETVSSGAYRVLVVSDPQEFLDLTRDLAEGDDTPSLYRDEYLASYLNTVFHEIAHVVLFAENAALLPPSEIDALCQRGDLDNDIFDCSTGYGIRPLLIDGREVWADDVDEAMKAMEDYVETLGRTFLDYCLGKGLSMDCFPAAMGHEDAFERIFHGENKNNPSPS